MRLLCAHGCSLNLTATSKRFDCVSRRSGRMSVSAQPNPVTTPQPTAHRVSGAALGVQRRHLGARPGDGGFLKPARTVRIDIRTSSGDEEPNDLGAGEDHVLSQRAW